MRQITRIASYVASALFGAALALLLSSHSREPAHDWLAVAWSGERDATTLSTDVFAGSDLPTPAITRLEAKAKFVAPTEATSNDLVLGYLVDVSVAVADLAKIPEKYKREKKAEVFGHSITRLPVADIAHEARFLFTLQDRDGFRVAEVESEPISLVSGKQARFQGLGVTKIPTATAARTASIQLRITIDRCLSCDD